MSKFPNYERRSSSIDLLSLSSVTQRTLTLAILLSLASASVLITALEFLNVKFAYAQINNLNNTTSQPNVNATNIYDSKTMILVMILNILSY